MKMEYKFIADDMLGKLAKWMRVMGCDVEYFPNISDRELAERAYTNGRIILTRDTLLIRRKKVRNNHFFIRSDDYNEQLQEVIKRFSLNPFAGFLTRCLLCNEPLQNIEKEQAAAHVPPYVYETRHSFKTCPSCKRIYWEATHKDRMQEHLEAILTDKNYL